MEMSELYQFSFNRNLQQIHSIFFSSKHAVCTHWKFDSETVPISSIYIAKKISRESRH